MRAEACLAAQGFHAGGEAQEKAVACDIEAAEA